MKPIFRGKVIKGQLVPYSREPYIIHIAKLEGAEVDIVIDKHREHRSDNQNRYFHGVVVPLIADTTGYSFDEAKEIVKGMFLKDYRTIGTQHGPVTLEIVRPTSSLNTQEFEQFLTTVREWACSELGCYIPLPNEVDF